MIINASQFFCQDSNPALTVYSSSAIKTSPVTSFHQAGNPATWRTNFQPFAFVIHDKQTQTLLLVRDHLGIHPLYYYYHDKKLIFADNIPDILCHLPSRPALLEEEIISLFSESSLYTDKTLYADIFRVEPGHMLLINPRGIIEKKAFWQLEREGETLHYRDDREYLEHFSDLMREAVANATVGHTKIAAEFSAGMDSSAVYCAAIEHGITPTLFMHADVANPTDHHYNDIYEKTFLEYFDIRDVHRLMADDIDPILILKNCATWFAGPAPHLFYMFAHNIHRNVSAHGYPILLSGFGGDQGISHHVSDRFILPEMIRKKQYKTAWRELGHKNLRHWRRAFHFVKYSHPVTHACMQSTQQFRQYLSAKLKNKTQQNYCPRHPYYHNYFKTLRDAEWSFLQGPFSHEIRMRIEYSSIVSKKMGFEYRYPLLYPKLLEFYLKLPMEQKRNKGIGRYLMRRYLATQLSNNIFDLYQKHEGLPIFQATLERFEQCYHQGNFQVDLDTFPYPDLIRHSNQRIEMIRSIQAFMLNAYLTNPR